MIATKTAVDDAYSKGNNGEMLKLSASRFRSYF